MLDKADRARQTGLAMIRRSFLAIAAALALVPLPARAAPGPANSVSCTYDMLSIEDREIAMVLMFVRYSDSGADRVSWLRGLTVAERMLEAANVQCRIAHRWSRTKSALARDYAFNSLLVEAMRQTLELEGNRSAEPIDRYFAQHAGELMLGQNPDSKQGKAFTAYLIEQGWDAEADADFKRARKYLEALAKRQTNVLGFAAGTRR
jgi:hypothetical protein